MTNEIAVVSNWESLKEQATALVKSGFLPPAVNTPEKAIALALAGKELGVGIMESMRSINIIQGKPTISPQLMLALANRTGNLKDIEIDKNDERCVVTITRKGRKPHTETFGIKEATALGLIGRDNYKKQPAVMFSWRCLAAALRVTFPDVVLGLYTPEELNANVEVSDEGDMVIVDDGGYVNTGVSVPKGFKKMTPEEQQERIGEGNVVRMTDKGLRIFSPKSDVEKFSQEMAVDADPLITHDERLEIVRLVQDRGIPKDEFIAYLEKEYGIKGTNGIKAKDYSAVTTWIIANGGEK